MVNTVRGEFTKTLGDLEITVCPTYKRMIRAETAIGKSMVTLGQEIAAGTMPELAVVVVLLEIMSKPKLKRDDIGEAIMESGLEPAIVLLGMICNRYMEGAGGSESDSLRLPGEEDDDEGKTED